MRQVTLEHFTDYVTSKFDKHGKENGRHSQAENLAIAGMGLAGEAGEVVDHFKKIVRDFGGDPAAYPPHKREELKLELGDQLHYFVYLTYCAGFTIPEIMAANIEKLDARFGRTPTNGNR